MEFSQYRDYDGLGLAELVASGQASPAELLATAMRRAARVNDRINALTQVLDEHATQRVKGELTGAFAGVPFLIKDLGQELAGTPSAAGSRSMAGIPAAGTATTVSRWLAAGLVIFGKTNSPEFGAKGITEPEYFGPTRNPWDTTRTPGGSSGGSAAAVAAGIVPVAGASDGGGSIRIPAACCGLVGIKAGRGLLPHGPAMGEQLHGATTDGVVSRTVRDSAAMLDLLMGPEPTSEYLPAMPERPLAAEVGRDPGRLRVGLSYRSALNPEVHPDAVTAVKETASVLQRLGHDVEHADPDYDDEELARDFLTMWYARNAAGVDETKRLLGASDDDFELDTIVMAALGRRTSAPRYIAAHQRWHGYVRSLARFHARYDLLLTPALSQPPLRIGALSTPPIQRAAAAGLLALRASGVLERIGVVDDMVRKHLGWVPYTQLANLTGRPAMSVPTYWNASGLPLGTQFVAPLGGESTLVRLAAQLESELDWFQRVPNL